MFAVMYPVALPDETVASLFVRACRISGVSDYADFASQFFCQTCPSFIGAKLDVPAICTKLHYHYGGPVAFLENLTFLGAQSRLGEIDDVTLTAMVQGCYRPSLSELVFSGPTELRYCWDCLQADLRKYGMTYWHRIHQIPVLPICPEHRKALIVCKVKKTRLQMDFPLPGDFQSDSPRHHDAGGSMEGFLWELAEVVRSSFRHEPSMGVSVVKATILDGLRSRRLVNNYGNIRKKDLVEQISVTLTESPHQASIVDSKTIAKQLVTGLESQNGLPFGNAVWIAWLFGSWEAFIERCRWVGVLGGGVSPSGSRIKQPVASDLIAHHRQVCTDYVRLNPGCTRLQFTYAEYRSFRWLLHNDAVWLQERLPVSRERRGQGRLF